MYKMIKETKARKFEGCAFGRLYEDEYTRLIKERPDDCVFSRFVNNYCDFMSRVWDMPLDVLRDAEPNKYVDKLDLNDMLNVFKMLNIMKKEIYRIDNVINNAIYAFRNIADFTDDGVIIKIKDFQRIGSTLPYGAEIHKIYKDMGLKGIEEVGKLCKEVNNKENMVADRLDEVSKKEVKVKRQFEALDEQKKQLRELINEFNRNSSDYEVLINPDTGKVVGGKKEPVTDDKFHLFS